MHADASNIQSLDAIQCCDKRGCVLLGEERTRHAINDVLECVSRAIRYHRSTAGQRLDKRDPEVLLAAEQKCPAVAQQLGEGLVLDARDDLGRRRWTGAAVAPPIAGHDQTSARR